ncbi:uncharacterized protein MONBRDRAFT_33983 [Monosiga brevicollis MX1]|uniref:NADH:ubiquinone oxidoreductase intermediate-associated protein 30 domain-containing protein n=1 Tax=Monosiga brevicollis TaxID=81824 RepID=A9V8X5_MONBE|nr:uncharacterized protein MONBRDRAFT_33983 [Monosiga brevicollis MX1]EDQ86035.1 predicted protein [Monosiga brevicollis MX1]|eukprot:XP_001749229.1 hypothetical protein [Monosiga brevicollis MX1]
MLKLLQRFFKADALTANTGHRVLFDLTLPETLKKFMVATDKDFFGGFSEAQVEHHPDGFARFKGHLSTTIPEGSKMERSGFALLRSRSQQMRRIDSPYLDIGDTNTLEFEVRGDGRPYIINLQSSSLHDEDLYQAFLYTRGGPHWQTVQIPLADFLLTHMGYVQNEQTLLSHERIRTIGFLLADQTDGPFQLDVRRISATTHRKQITRLDVNGAQMTSPLPKDPSRASEATNQTEEEKGGR